MSNPIERAPIDFAGSFLKVARARRHTAAFAEEFKALNQTDFASMYVTHNRASGQFDLRFGGARPFSGELQLTAADALYNLRSALDQAACTCAKLAGKSPKDTYFPHGKCAAHFETNLAKQCKKLPEMFKAQIRASEPYYGGAGYLIRALHKLNVVDKHTELIKQDFAMKELHIDQQFEATPEGLVIQPATHWISEHPAEEADTIETTTRGVRFNCTLSFGEVEVVRGRAVRAVLEDMASYVEKIILMLQSVATSP